MPKDRTPGTEEERGRLFKSNPTDSESAARWGLSQRQVQRIRRGDSRRREAQIDPYIAAWVKERDIIEEDWVAFQRWLIDQGEDPETAEALAEFAAAWRAATLGRNELDRQTARPIPGQRKRIGPPIGWNAGQEHLAVRRRAEVWRLTDEGYSAREIGEWLEISDRQVRRIRAADPRRG